MNNMLVLSQNIRTNTADKLLRKVSLVIMQNTLTALFTDRTAIDVSIGRFFNKKNLEVESEYSIYKDCMNLNDEKTIDWNNKIMNIISDGVLVNELELKPHHNMFIPFDNGDEQ